AHAWLLGGGVHAGDRLPDAELIGLAGGAPRRLYEIIAGTRHHLLLLTGVQSPREQVAALAAIGAEVQRRYGDLVVPHVIAASEESRAAAGGALPDPADPLPGCLGAASPTLYLVRPDGYVGFRSQPAEAASLLAHLAGYLN